MKTKTQATVYECDNPDCYTARVYVKGDEELPLGFHIKSVFYIGGGGGSGTKEVYACSEKCLTAAVLEALSNQ